MRAVFAQLDKQIKSGGNCVFARGALLAVTPPASLCSLFLPENSFPPFIVLGFGLGTSFLSAAAITICQHFVSVLLLVRVNFSYSLTVLCMCGCVFLREKWFV